MPRTEARRIALLVRLMLRHLVDQHDELDARWARYRIRGSDMQERTRYRPQRWFNIADAREFAQNYPQNNFTDDEIQEAMEEAFRQFDDVRPLHHDTAFDFVGDIIDHAAEAVIGREEFTQWARRFMQTIIDDPEWPGYVGPSHPGWANYIGPNTLVTGEEDYRREIGMPLDLQHTFRPGAYTPTASALHRWRRDNPEAAAVNDPNDPVAYDEWMWMETSSRGTEYD